MSLLPEIHKPLLVVPTVTPCDHDLEAVCPLSMIRTHTKTDDVPHVTDDQLIMYRKTAFEVAEKYTGLLFSGAKRMDEGVDIPHRARRREFYKYRLKHPSADGIVYLYGSRGGYADRTLHVDRGATVIKIPIVIWSPDANPCCGPTGKGEINYDMRIMYLAGYVDITSIPAGIVVGVLKMISWLLANPGDIFVSVMNKTITENQFQVGTNNAAVASGALEQWRIYMDDAI